MASEKLEAARRSGSLTNAIGVLREEARAEAATVPVREQVDLVDAAIRVGQVASAAGTRGADRRSIFRELQAGKTVTKQGVGKTGLTREQKFAKTLAWAKALTEDQRAEFIVSEKFDALSDRQQELISEAFGQIEDRAYEDSIGIANVDLDAPTPDVDTIIGDEDDGEADLGEADYEALFEAAQWEGE